MEKPTRKEKQKCPEKIQEEKRWRRSSIWEEEEKKTKVVLGTYQHKDSLTHGESRVVVG